MILKSSARGGRNSRHPHDQYGESRRQARVAQQVRSELASMLRSPHAIKTSDVVDPAVLAATSILDVSVSPDLLAATATVTTHGDAAARRAAFAWLVRNEKPVRYALARRLRHAKRVPAVTFRKADVAAATALMARIDEVNNAGQTGAGRDDPDSPFTGPIDGLDFEDLDDEDDDFEDDDDDFEDEDDLTPEERAFLLGDDADGEEEVEGVPDEDDGEGLAKGRGGQDIHG